MKYRDYTNIKQEVEIIKNYKSDTQLFDDPSLLARGLNGELIVGNNNESAKHVVMFNQNLHYVKDISAKAYEEKFEGTIRGLAVEKCGKFLYVTDSRAHCVKKFALHDGKFISQFGRHGTDDGQFREPSGLLISKSNFLYVCDRLNHRIQVFHGKDFLFKFGKYAFMQEPSNFIEPNDLTMNNSEQELYITDCCCHRIQVFTPNGMYLRLIISTDPIKLMYPRGIFCTPDDHLLVCSIHYVLIFKVDGTFVSAIEGKFNGVERFTDCHGVIMMNDGKIVVADGLCGTNRLIVF